MNSSRETLERATNDCFNHLGVDATYSGEGVAPISIVVLKFASDTEYEFGDGHMVSETAKFEIRMDDIARPLPNHIISIDDVSYKIFGEPVRNLERRTWDVNGMVMSS